MVRVKICGITNLEDALVAVAAGADALGFNFWLKSPRFVEPRRAAKIIAQLPPLVTPVGVFVNEPRAHLETLARKTGIRTVQLHGEESPEETTALTTHHLTVIKALRVGPDFYPEQLRRYKGVSTFLLDADVKGQRGGTGKTFDCVWAQGAGPYGWVFLAGGLTVENVAAAIRQGRPYGVDVCTGVEKEPGKKDHARLREFIERAKGAKLA